MDGIPLARPYRNDPVLAKLPVVNADVVRGSDAERAGARAGIRRVTTKPVRRAQLLDAMLAALAPNRARRDARPQRRR